MALIALASVVNANASALGIGAANDGSRARVFDFEGVALTDLRRERDIESEDEAFLDVAELKATPSFGVTSIGATAQNSGASGQQQSQQTIATLTEIVDNLSQQLSRKDQKIEFLEKQIYELKSKIGEDVPVGSLALAPVQPPLLSEVGNVSTNALAVESSAPANQTAPLWPWLSLCFFALSSSIYLMRARLYTLGQSLNLFGFNDQLEFNSVAEQTLSHRDLEVYRQSKLRSTEAHSPKSKIQSPTDDVITGAIETSMADREIFEDISYLGLSDDGSY
ncbi:MAG: hypothetical protein JKX81_15275, partial [Arenicella sp.]|nr:hypothetical protein [Arenicella sp.]